MRQKLSQLPSPVLAGVINQKSMAGAISEIKNCNFSGASMVDLHLEWLEHLTEEALGKIMDSTRLPVLALHYPKGSAPEDGEDAEEARTERLLQAVKAGASGIDMQGYTFHRPSKSGFYGMDKYSFTKGKSSVRSYSVKTFGNFSI